MDFLKSKEFYIFTATESNLKEFIYKNTQESYFKTQEFYFKTQEFYFKTQKFYFKTQELHVVYMVYFFLCVPKCPLIY